jgi:hypothetical protein
MCLFAVPGGSARRRPFVSTRIVLVGRRRRRVRVHPVTTLLWMAVTVKQNRIYTPVQRIFHIYVSRSQSSGSITVTVMTQ